MRRRASTTAGRSTKRGGNPHTDRGESHRPQPRGPPGWLLRAGTLCNHRPARIIPPGRGPEPGSPRRDHIQRPAGADHSTGPRSRAGFSAPDPYSTPAGRPGFHPTRPRNRTAGPTPPHARHAEPAPAQGQLGVPDIGASPRTGSPGPGCHRCRRQAVDHQQAHRTPRTGHRARTRAVRLHPPSPANGPNRRSAALTAVIKRPAAANPRPPRRPALDQREAAGT
jgi:hypothetical protein